MSNNIQRSRGRPSGYKFDRGGAPAESGPYIGIVKQNVDPTRSGRLRVYIEQFSGGDENNESLWRYVDYVPPFYGVTPQTGTSAGVGTYVGNPNAYGMWFTPPDVGVAVICFFVTGDPNQGYYIGCVPDPGLNHMVPAIGASKNFKPDNQIQTNYLSQVKQAPVTEINDDNNALVNNPRFFDQKKPVHGWQAGIMIEQGLIKDVIRGPITSSSQRESPSATFGISTPGRAIYNGGLSEQDIKGRLQSADLKLSQVVVTGRRAGHSIVLDDGNLEGFDNLVRIRTSKGHQITMSDDGDCFYFIHANGQTWIELGSEGTVDVFATNSVNIRSKGELNFHADTSINMFATDAVNIKSKTVKIEGTSGLDLISQGKLGIYAKTQLSVSSDGTLAMSSKAGGWKSDTILSLKARPIDLNGLSPIPTTKPSPIPDVELPDTTFKNNVGWVVEEKKIKTIVSRAPTHEPYPYHNLGVQIKTSLSQDQPQTYSDDIPPEISISRDE